MSMSLQEYREERLMTVAEFADYLGVSQDTLYRLQRGTRPRLKTMRNIAQRLGVHPSEITDFQPYLPSSARAPQVGDGTSDDAGVDAYLAERRKKWPTQ